MKRSEINSLIENSIDFMNRMNFFLPKWGYWKPEDWKGKEIDEIIGTMLGWDITDFGRGKFKERGLILFTLRNGNIKKTKKVNKIYGEKVLIVGENQETPFHFHWSKMEDIINRGGGDLIIELYNSDDREDFSDKPVTVMIDSIPRKVSPGGKVVLTPGESICLEPYVYHRFYAENGRVLAGEVSSVNDDAADNRFHEPLGRFPEITEDTAPSHLLVIDYEKHLMHNAS
ncbi:MAG: D-lyxose/D-mannose family sugar isomerase [Spirochaetales bacterium]|nr:D-lyxose/D-mannose family sugar isomerase [Spirochaetales bacterium]